MDTNTAIEETSKILQLIADKNVWLGAMLLWNIVLNGFQFFSNGRQLKNMKKCYESNNVGIEDLKELIKGGV